MRIEVRNRCADFTSYRAARVKSLFNVEDGTAFDLDADLEIDDDDWRLGLVVGPSGSGKTSIGSRIFGPEAIWSPEWPGDAPIVDAIAKGGRFDDVTAALAAVGLGDVPTWLRPHAVLSNGEKFRADLARLVSEAPARVVVDEFTSVVDRQIARIGALAFAKAWRRTSGQAVMLSCHRDIVEWLDPDWIFDTETREFARGRLRSRPSIDLEVRATDWSLWPLFEPHHYLKLPKMVGAKCYVGTVDGEPVAHVAMATKNVGRKVEARGCRLVIMPEWQGAGVGLRFLNEVCRLNLEGLGRLPGRRLTTIFHTSHPGLCAALRRDARWAQVSAVLHGGHKAKSNATLRKSQAGSAWAASETNQKGFGGHFRAIQGFRYLGDAYAEKVRACAS